MAPPLEQLLAKKLRLTVYAGLCSKLLKGKGPVRQKSISIGLIFCYFWIKPNGEALLSTYKKQITAKKVTHSVAIPSDN